MPRIVGSQVKLNPLISIVGIFIAGSITGISGMFLALPIMAILKIIFDRTEQFKKWGVLLGDERPAKKPMRIAAILRLKSATRLFSSSIQNWLYACQAFKLLRTWALLLSFLAK